MADDFDPFDDIFGNEPVKNARAAGKFRPKPKVRPQKKVSAKSSVASSQAVQTVHSAPHDSSEPIHTVKPLEQSSDVVPNDKPDFHAVSVEENPDVLIGSEAYTDSLHHTDIGCTIPSSKEVASNSPNDENIGGRVGTQVFSSIDDSTNTCKMAEVTKDSDLASRVDALGAGHVATADAFDPFDDIFDNEPVKNARVAGKFRPKPKFQPQKVSAKSLVASSNEVQSVNSAPHDSSEPIVKPLEQKCTIPSSKEVASNAPKTENIGGREGTQVSSSIDDSTNTFYVADATKESDQAAEADALGAGEPLVSSADVYNDMDGRRVIEEMDVMDSVMPDLNSLQQDSAENNSIPTSQNGDAVDLSSPGFTDTFPTKSTSELPLDEESINLMEVPQSDSCIHVEDLPEVPSKLASRRAKTGKHKPSAASGKQQASTLSEETGAAGRSVRSKKRDTSVGKLVDEEGDETLASGQLSEEHPFSSAIDEQNINSEQPQVENGSQKKNSKRKLKKTENDKEKPPRKSKKAKEAPEQETCTKPKKFSHSTRRRRILDKNLLNIPEEEFNPRELSFRNLILLAEYKEKQMKTTGQAAAPATHQSTRNSDYNYDPSTGLYNNDEEDGAQVDTTEYFNYQSRMEKTPRVRWTKQDTELFYEAVQQFGTDFSMIAQLFPGRTREQIRNKYKKEERQYPLRLREAFTNRSKDLSHFGKVIENLNKIREQEELEDCTSTEGVPDEGVSNADDDGGKHEDGKKEENEDAATDTAEVQSAAKPETQEEEEEEDEEDELSRYSQIMGEMKFL
ncbi:transcription factor TFIIIB component B'' [Salvia hispanica]|uniref:transcription factor TFIIIB component B'' n=1 Tax=Salvia hispanica TaxID=49212 RepID=UPI002009D6FC|nr:transcription factor TFIIIB component B'' [Salvia hispanica]XP_047974135.1 transcription factor TFIIIB component B'' [Salvia hispanica]